MPSSGSTTSFIASMTSSSDVALLGRSSRSTSGKSLVSDMVFLRSQDGILERHPRQQRAFHAGRKLGDAGKGDTVFQDVLVGDDLPLALHHGVELIEHGQAF